MRFDPRLIQPDDAPLLPDGEVDLPADLSALAEQLTDDAAHLAGRYPAERDPAVALAAELVESAGKIKARAWRRTALAIIAATGLATVAALAATITLGMFPVQSLSHNPAAPATALPTVGAPSRSIAEDTQPAIARGAASLAPAAGTLSLGELSGPEREALFDLLQHDSNRSARVSF